MNHPVPPAASSMHQGGGELNASAAAERLPCHIHIRILCLVAVLVFTAPARGQDERVTDNDVIRVAERMYCPVCENIPLDDCETIACVDWKAEIRAQLAAGKSDQAIINSFVARFGDNVVGVPQDPVLRALTVIMPLLATGMAIGLAVFTFRRFGQQARDASPGAEDARFGGDSLDRPTSDEAYRQRLEDDLRGRR